MGSSSNSRGSRWLLLQLTDATFPSGGFAHSGGLEAAVRLGGLRAIEDFLEQAVVQAARGAAPFVRAACENRHDLEDLDRLCHVSVTSHVANRASRAQGRALISSAARIFEEAEVQEITRRARASHAHLPPMFGALYGALGIEARETEMAFLHGVVRAVLSAGVRLGLLGPLEAQSVHAGMVSRLDDVLAECTNMKADETVQTAPIVELFGSLHDVLDARLFQS